MTSSPVSATPVAASAAAPDQPAATPPVRTWLQPVVIALVVVAAFLSCYLGLQRDPQPRGIPVAVAGADLPGQVGQALGDRVDIRPVADAAAAREAVLRHDAVAALSADGQGGLELRIAGAEGASNTSAVKALVGAYAGGAGLHLTTEDVVPLAPADARGLAGFYLAFGVSLAGFVLASNALGLAGALLLRHRLWLLAGTSLAIGTVAAIIAGPVLGAVPGALVPLALTLALLAAAAGFTTKLLGTYLGPIGLPVATLVLLTLGNAVSGAVVGADLLPTAARALSPLLPPGAAVRAISDLSYFHGAHAMGPVLTLALWAAGAALLIWLRPRLTRHRTTTVPA
ncbi:hypothetical protein [Catellatospora bangladeshensis]|uniref:ABC transporter permease n=1 Tax=Catellatospora bangladeshensis TaxID=310355 RepID=A0A8J3JPL4_9ACTN|nr:hypothetical protein [Catellatospora bangladeshensis]GIF84413.1 hypothetical protein Cba03nite_57620 [Catellatospora bangladeshensis]